MNNVIISCYLYLGTRSDDKWVGNTGDWGYSWFGVDIRSYRYSKRKWRNVSNSLDSRCSFPWDNI